LAAPYDVPEMISLIAQLLLSQTGQTAIMRLLGDSGLTVADLKAIVEKQTVAEKPTEEQ
jgi:hypothetical protein